MTIPAPVTEIGDNAFAKCENLAEVTLSEGLKTIGRNAFGGCTTLKEIEIPASAEEIAGKCVRQQYERHFPKRKKKRRKSPVSLPFYSEKSSEISAEVYESPAPTEVGAGLLP